MAQFTSACNQNGFPPFQVPTGGDSATLWNRPQPAGIPLPPAEQILGSIDDTRALQDQWGHGRLYRTDVINDGVFGGLPAVARPPFVGQWAQAPTDMSKRDFPIPPMLPAPEEYARKLYVDPFIQPVPIITPQQLQSGRCYNLVTV